MQIGERHYTADTDDNGKAVVRRVQIIDLYAPDRRGNDCTVMDKHGDMQMTSTRVLYPTKRAAFLSCDDGPDCDHGLSPFNHNLIR